MCPKIPLFAKLGLVASASPTLPSMGEQALTAATGIEKHTRKCMEEKNVCVFTTRDKQLQVPYGDFNTFWGDVATPAVKARGQVLYEMGYCTNVHSARSYHDVDHMQLAQDVVQQFSKGYLNSPLQK